MLKQKNDKLEQQELNDQDIEKVAGGSEWDDWEDPNWKPDDLHGKFVWEQFDLS